MLPSRKRRVYTLRSKKPRQIPLDFLAGYTAIILVCVYVVLFSVLQEHPANWSTLSLGYFTIIIPIWIIDGLKVFIESFSQRHYLSAEEDLSKVTVVIACKDGEDVIGPTLKSLTHRFEPSQIIVASNGSHDATCQIARGYSVRVLDIKQPLGKVRAINYALRYVTTPYVLLLDDDTLVNDAVIPTGLLEQGYDGVAFRVLVKESGWVTKFQAHEYKKTTDLGKRYHNKKASVQNISGAIGLFKLNQLRWQINRHSGEFSGEDLQRTLLIHLAQNARGVVLADSTVLTQPPETIGDLFKQRSYGWFPGLYANVPNYLRILTRDHMPMALRFDAFYNVFLVMLLDIVRLLSLPILFLYPWYFAVMYILYVLFESIAYLNMKSKDPYWVVLLYPIYGMFGFMTRVSAFATFMYRRFSVRMAKKQFIDDYRSVKPRVKWTASLLSAAVLSIVLFTNAIYFYIEPIINLGF